MILMLRLPWCCIIWKLLSRSACIQTAWRTLDYGKHDVFEFCPRVYSGKEGVRRLFQQLVYRQYVVLNILQLLANKVKEFLKGESLHNECEELWYDYKTCVDVSLPTDYSEDHTNICRLRLQNRESYRC